jgi:multiple sugar transport system substrate-binding protein
LLDRFERERPRFRVQMERLGWQDGLARIEEAIHAGSVPDLCELGSTWMPRLLATRQLADWSAGAADLKRSLRGWELCTVGDAVYGVPWTLGTRALFFNKTLFARAGLDSTRPPETWAELYADAQAIQKLGGAVRGFGVQTGERAVLFKKFMPFAWGNGGKILTDDLSGAIFDSPQNREALEFYLSLREVGVLDRQAALDRSFRAGTLGLELSGAWLFPSIARESPRLRYGVALVPRPDVEHGTHASFAGGELLVTFQGSRHKAWALELARFLAQPENAVALAIAAGNVQPAVAEADTMPWYRQHPEQQTMIRQYETAVPAPNHPAWTELEAMIEDEVDLALHDSKSAAQAVTDANRKIAARLGARH